MPTAPRVFRPSHYRPPAERPRTYDDRRGNSNERGYNSKWRKARESYLAAHPLCVHCARTSRAVPATEVDHVTPHRGDMKLFWDSDNWQPLCKRCHSRKTAGENGGFGNASRNQ